MKNCTIGVFLLILSFVEPSFGNNNGSVLSLDTSKIDTCHIYFSLKSGQTSFGKNLIVKAAGMKKPLFEPDFLLEEKTGNVLRDISFTASPAQKSGEYLLNIELKKIPGPGLYQGRVIVKENNQSKYTFVLAVMFWPEDAVVVDPSDKIIVLDLTNANTNGFWGIINKIIPTDPDFGISFSNNSNYPIALGSSSFLKKKNEVFFNTKLKVVPNSEIVLQPRGPQIVGFKASASGVKAGEYAGMLKISSGHDGKSKNIPISINVKRGAYRAIFCLLLGLMLGWIARKNEESEKQINAYEKTVKLEPLILLVTDEPLKKEYARELESIKFRLQQTTNDAEVVLIEKEISDLKKKVENNLTSAGIQVTNATSPSPLSVNGDDIDDKRTGPFFKLSKKIYNFLFKKPSLPRLLYVYRTWLYLFSITITTLFVYWEVYMKNPTFGADGFYDDMRIFLAGAGITIVANALFSQQLKQWAKRLG